MRSTVARAGFVTYLRIQITHPLDWEDLPVVEMESHSVSDEVLGTRLEPELGIHVLHRALVDIQTCSTNWPNSRGSTCVGRRASKSLTLVGCRVRFLPVLEILKEVLRPPFLEQPHQRTPHSLHLRTRHFRDPPIPKDIASRDGLKLEIAGDVSVDEHTGELAGREDEFGDEVDGVVPVSTEFEVVGWRCGAELLVQLETVTIVPSIREESKPG